MIIYRKHTRLAVVDREGRRADQSGPSVEALPGGVCLSGQGHADDQPMPGGVLARQSQEQRPQGYGTFYFSKNVKSIKLYV